MNISVFGLSIFFVSILAVYKKPTPWQRLSIYKASFMVYGMAYNGKTNKHSVANGVLVTDKFVLTAGHFCGDTQIQWFLFGMGSVQYHDLFKKATNISTKAHKAAGPLCMVQLSGTLELTDRMARSVFPTPSTPKPNPQTVLHMGTYGDVASLNVDTVGDALHYRAVYVVHVESGEEIGLAADKKGGKLELHHSHVGNAVWMPSTRKIVGIVLKRDNNAQAVAAFMPALKRYVDEGRAAFNPKLKMLDASQSIEDC